MLGYVFLSSHQSHSYTRTISPQSKKASQQAAAEIGIRMLKDCLSKMTIPNDQVSDFAADEWL